MLVFLASAPLSQASSRSPAVNQPDLLAQIDTYQRSTWRWQRVMSAHLTPTVHSARREPKLAYRRWVRDLWHRRAARARKQAQNPPHKRALLCIHRYEATWNDPNPPYYGGLQMDRTFMKMYGARLLRMKGPASNWTPLEQLWVAERALRAGRGFYPWPRTARACGLI